MIVEPVPGYSSRNHQRDFARSPVEFVAMSQKCPRPLQFFALLGTRESVEQLNARLRKIFAPSRLDGPFWTLWIWLAIPIAVAASIYTGGLAQVRWAYVAGSFYFMMLGVTLGFHRYFSHRSYTTGRFFQFVLGLMGTLSGQTGPLSWSLGHDVHHRNCENQADPHSTGVGFWHAHGFFLWNGKSRYSNLEDSPFFKFQELVLLEAIAPIIYYSSGVVLLLTVGWTAAVWYWLVPTFLSWNATMMINSLGHGHGLFPYKDFYKPEDCRATNIPWAWPFILGDNWHCNHHAYPNAAFHGWEWWEIDPNRYLLRVLQAVRVIQRPLMPSPKVLAKNAASRETMPPHKPLTAINVWVNAETEDHAVAVESTVP
jgi:stearoyl-CoA desaturase (delta-9 desaturase)